jgi:hypothetical protein
MAKHARQSIRRRHGPRHLADDSRQQNRRMLPADHVEALECLIDEVERMSRVGKHSLGLGRD